MQGRKPSAISNAQGISADAGSREWRWLGDLGLTCNWLLYHEILVPGVWDGAGIAKYGK